jgi:hypothetical protein
LAQKTLGRLAHIGFAMTMNEDASVAQVFIEGDLGDIQPLCNLVDAIRAYASKPRRCSEG